MMDRDDQVEGAAAFAISRKITNSDKPTCKHCGKFDHNEANCFEVIGYPPGWSSRGRGRGGRATRGATVVALVVDVEEDLAVRQPMLW